MSIFSTVLAKTGWILFGKVIGKTCDISVKSAHDRLNQKLTTGKIDPNHDIERAILRAHYRALQYILKQSKLDEYGAGVGNSHTYINNKIQQIHKGDLKTVQADLVKRWNEIVPLALSHTAENEIPVEFVKAAMSELIEVNGWDENEKKIIYETGLPTETGWQYAFVAFIREELKSNEKFRDIYSAFVLEQQSGLLEQIIQHLPSLSNLQESIDKTIERLTRIEKKIDGVITQSHYWCHGNYYPTYLAKILLRTDIPEHLWESEIASALERYVAGVAQLEKLSNLPSNLEDQRKLALQHYEKAEIEQGENILENLLKTVKLKYNAAALEYARILIDLVPFSVSKFEFNEAISKYLEAAQIVSVINVDTYFDYLLRCKNLAYSRAVITGEISLHNKTVEICKTALKSFTVPGTPEGKLSEEWALFNYGIGQSFAELGERADDLQLLEAEKALNNTLMIWTKENNLSNWAKAHSNLASTSYYLGIRGDSSKLIQAEFHIKEVLKNLDKFSSPLIWARVNSIHGNLLWALGYQGNAEKYTESIAAYDNALEIYSKDTHPKEWAGTIRNRAFSAQELGEQGDEVILQQAITDYEAALTFFTEKDQPYSWAKCTADLATAYWFIGEKNKAKEMLNKSLTYFHSINDEFSVNRLNIILSHWDTGATHNLQVAELNAQR